GAGAENVREGGGQPVAELLGGRPAVERLDQGLAVVVVPEADLCGLAARHRAAVDRPLAEVVVDGVNLRGQLDEELIDAGNAAGSHAVPGADGVDARVVAGRLRRGDVVVPRTQVAKLVEAGAVGGHRQIDGMPKVVGSAQCDAHAADAVFAEINL